MTLRMKWYTRMKPHTEMMEQRHKSPGKRWVSGDTVKLPNQHWNSYFQTYIREKELEPILTDIGGKSGSQRIVKRWLQRKKKLMWWMGGVMKNIRFQIYFGGSVENIHHMLSLDQSWLNLWAGRKKHFPWSQHISVPKKIRNWLAEEWVKGNSC